MAEKEDGDIRRGGSWYPSNRSRVSHVLHLDGFCMADCSSIWERFNHRTQMMKGLFAYESAFRNYTRACIEDFVHDNIQYAEIRPNFMSTNTLKKDDGVGSIRNEGI